MGILSDEEIERAMSRGEILINPYEKKQLNPVSYDLTLGDEVAVYKDWVHTITPDREDGRFFLPMAKVSDAKEPLAVEKFKIDPEKGWVLNPGIGYLMNTRERIHTKKFVPIVDGKSSVGRLFILVHFTAGFGDPGFDGQYTLEVSSLHPIRVYPGMRIGQIRFHTIEGEVQNPYNGNYTGERAVGPVPSRAWNQFTK